MGKSTADAATAKLFGAPTRAPKTPSAAPPAVPSAAPTAASPPPATPAPRPAPRPAGAAAVSPAPTRRSVPAAPAPKRAAATPGRVTTPPARKAVAESPRPAAEETRNTGNYLGQSLYLYKGVEARKLSVYVEPSLAAGLRMAAASGADPRGSDMSEIVDTLLRENGYADWRPPAS